jgi:hypothetical protein
MAARFNAGQCLRMDIFVLSRDGISLGRKKHHITS